MEIGRICRMVVMALVLGWVSEVRAATPQPVVAIHISETTHALESLSATFPTPTGPGTTGFQWWMTVWQYHAIYEPLEEALRSDGTPFVELSDNDVATGLLLNSDGTPRYPILISLAAEAVPDGEITPLSNFVNAGGTLFLGSSTLTRRPDGSSRGDFALASAMGLQLQTPSLTNWYLNTTFSKTMDHRLVAHIPIGRLNWRMATTAEEIPLGTSPSHPIHSSRYSWAVRAVDAQVIAVGDSGPLLSVKQNGQGRIIFFGDMQPILGHGGHDNGMYTYEIFRNAITWAFELIGSPLVRVSPWRYPYDAAMVVRHDFENNPDLISSIESSAQAEASAGVRGDYFFCTGALRVNMTNSAATIDSLNRAVANYGATIGSHNGGFTNWSDPNLTPDAYNYWHWGPDELLGVNPPGFSSGSQYVSQSISNSFVDLETWIPSNLATRRTWVAPYFNGTRDASCQILEQLGVLTSGEQKAGPFPQWVLSSQTAGKRYAFISLPNSEWYYDRDVMDALEQHSAQTLHACIDHYYSLGALINNYGHVSAASPIGGNYVDYALSKPRIWSANALGIYDWWKARSPVSVVGSYSLAGSTAVFTGTVSGASDPDTSVELAIPYWNAGAGSIMQVLVNGVPATYRTNSSGIKIRVGAATATFAVTFSPLPKANDDAYSVNVGSVLNVSAPGVLANDGTPSGKTLNAALLSGPLHGTLALHPDGSFSYTPAPGFSGTDTFTYRASDGVLNSSAATATIQSVIETTLFSDSFSDGTVDPWSVVLGSFTSSGGMLNTTLNPGGSALAFTGTGWTDFAVRGQFQFLAGDSPTAGLGGRYNSSTGARYAALIAAQGSLDSQATLTLIKFYDWFTWSYVPMQEVILPPVGTNVHTLKLSFLGAQIAVDYDGSTLIRLTDNNFDGYSPFWTGGVSLEFYPGTGTGQMSADNVSVAVSAVGASQPVLTVNVDSQARPYGQANPSLTGSLSGVINGDNITATYVTAASAGSGAGAYAITPVLNDPNNRLANYIVVTNLGTLTIVPASLTVVATAADKVYDGTTAASVTLSDNRIAGDSLSIAYTGAVFSDRNSGVGKRVTVAGLTVGGSSAANYSLNSNTISTTANITARSITVSAVTASKIYDGSIGSPSLPVISIGSLAPGDSANFIQTFDTKNVGASKLLTPSGLITDGNGGNNYSLSFIAANSGAITRRSLIVSATAANKGYDGTAIAVVALSDNRVSGDVFASSYSDASFADKNIGANKIVTVSGITINGIDAGNYTANSTATATANITAARLLVTADDKSRPVGATNPTFTVTYSGFVGGDSQASVISGSPSIATTATAASPVGSYPITVSPGTLAATNYSLVFSNGVLTIFAGPSSAPIITSQPVSLTNVAGSTATFAVSASGDPAPVYQWLKGNAPITGATSATLTFVNVSTTNAGSYSVVVTNSAGGATSAVATLTVLVPPQITSQPTNLAILPGVTATFRVTASGTAPLAYQWFKNTNSAVSNGGDISGASSNALVISNVDVTDIGSYLVVVTNAAGSVTSSPAALVVYSRPSLPTISTQTVNEMVTFTVSNTAADPNVVPANLRYSLVNPPSGAAIGTNGVITWKPTEAQGYGVYTLTTIVTERVFPNLSATNSFTVIVNEVNRAPVLPNILSVNAIVSSPIRIASTATDPDIPANSLSYGLVNPPAGAAIDSNGVITWTPTTANTYTLTVVVTDYNPLAVNSRSLSDTNKIKVRVTRALAAASAVVPTYTIDAGQPIAIASTADNARFVSYSLVSGPQDAIVDSATGLFTWRGCATVAGTTNRVQIQAKANAQPSFANTQEFIICVTPAPVAKLTPLGSFTDGFHLQVEGPVGPDYILEMVGALQGLSWLPLQTNTPDSMPFTFTDTNASTGINGIYRVRIAP